MASYDFIVLGSGPAWRKAAVQAAKPGRSVMLIDDRARIGGVSVHTGTIPSKTLRETVLNRSGWRERGFYGPSCLVKREIGANDLCERLGKTLDHEIAVLDPHRLVVTSGEGDRQVEEVVTADKILIAVGTRPHRPSHIPFNGDTLIEPRAMILDFMDRELIDNLIYQMHDRSRTRSRTSPWSAL